MTNPAERGKISFMAKVAVKTDLGTGSVGKLFVRLALPAVLAQVINLLYNMVDRMFVGAIPGEGTDALAGLGVCFPVLMIVSAFSALVGVGGSPLASMRLGENKKDEAEKILNNGVTVLAALGVVLTVILLVFSRPILKIFGSPESSLPYGDDYLKIYAIGTLFVMFALGLNTYISTQGFAFTSMLTVAIGAAMNIALDPLFIFVFKMGVKGAALATVISQGVSCAFVLAFFFGKRTNIKIRFSRLRPKAEFILPMLALGVSPFIMQATESAVQIVFNVQLRKYTGGDANYTAALTIMLSVMQIISLPLSGMGTGAQPLMSFNYGAGNFDRVKKTVKYVFLTALGICSFVWLLCLTCPWIFAKIFSATDAVTEIIKKYMPVFMMGTIFFCAQFGLQNAFLALGQAKISLTLAVLRKIILLIPLTFVFPLFMGVSGVFWAEGVADITAGVITSLTFALTFKKILRKRAEVLEKERAETSSAE